MKNIFKKSLLFIAAGLVANSVWSVSIYKTELKANPTGATTTFTKGEFATPPTWVTGGYSSCFHTTGSAGEVTVAFNTPIDLSGYSNCKFILTWGAESNRPVNLAINGGSATQIDAVTTSADRNKVRTVTTNLSVTSISSINLKGSGGGNSYYIQIEITGDAAGPVAVTGVSLNKTATSIEAGQAEQLTATVLPANADNKSVTWSSNNTAVATVDQNGNVSALTAGTATITVTTEDGNKTATCTVTVTAPAAPIDVQSISMKSATTIAIGASETLTVTYTPADANTNKALTWTSNNTAVATVDANGKVTGISAGTATITATTTNNKSATCTVTVQAVSVTGVSLNKSSLSLQIGGSETLTATIAPADATNKNISWTSSNSAVATVDNNGKVTAKAAGNTTITVTTADGNKTATCEVTVTAGPPVPQTDLTTHVPEIYEAKEIAGGYGGTLSVFGGREYEVYYGSYTEKNDTLTITVFPTQKSSGITTPINKTSFKAADGWFKGTAVGGKSNYTFSNTDEFKAGAGALHKLKNGNEYEFHISGYDQFSFMGKDNNADISKGRYLQVYVDGVLQTSNLSTSYTIRRFNITTGEHVIKIKAIHDGDSQSEICGFSLRVAQEPRTKYLKGNDSTQTVLQTTNIKPITYVTKYNNIPGAQTRLVWDGPEATGIDLTEIEGSLSDTLVVSGQADCPVGEYKYHVSAYYNGVETNRVSGKFKVISSIAAKTGTNADAYTGEEMDQIIFTYYAMSPEDVILTWPNGQPDGINGSGANGKYIIGGTPTATGTFPYSITTQGGDTTIQGKIVITAINYGPRSVLYLYKNDLSYEKDAVYQYLNGSGNNKWDLIYRKQKEDGNMRPTEQYANYKWILISEDVDANNPEIIGLIRGGGANLPILNLKGFTYSSDRLDWGEPDNGAIDTTKNTKVKGTKLYIQQPNHPIFKEKMSYLKKGDSIQVLSNYELNGLMPINVFEQGTFCLATAYTRDINNYYGNGELQTALHEVPANMRGGKYICLPMARDVTLTNTGKNLLDGIVSYLMSPDDSGLELPNPQINSFTLFDLPATINQAENTITISLPQEKYDDLATAHPVITLADPNTHVTPSVEPSIDLRNAIYFPQTFVVSDYINRRAYSLTIEIYDPQGIEDVYTAGQWVNIYDIYGRKVATTNEDIYTMELPRGMYIIVTESGETLKIMR